MRRRAETHTIQTWPGGQAFEYRGDPSGPPNQRSLRDGYYQARVRCGAGCERIQSRDGHLSEPPGTYVVPLGDGDKRCDVCAGAGYLDNPKKNPWRKGTADEWRRIKIELCAQNLQRNDVFCCDSALVDDLIKAHADGCVNFDDAFGYEEIRNLYPDPSDWSFDQCVEYIEDQGLRYPNESSIQTAIRSDSTRNALIEAVAAIDDGYTGDGSTDAEIREHLQNLISDTDHDMDALRDVCRDHAQDNPAEVFEWWRVSSWLCAKLHAIGEVTIDNGYGHWWGRTCTGQQYIMDGTLQQVAAGIVRETE